MDAQDLHKKRHSAAHVLAQAVQNIYQEQYQIKLGIGPEIENGFYYDFLFTNKENGNIENPISENDLKTIEKEMKKIIRQNQHFVQYELPKDEAIKKLKDMAQDFKVELAKDIEDETISFYENKDQKDANIFADMCAGPHVQKTADLDEKALKIEKTAGAYWRGSSDNPMMVRIYGLLFESKEALDEYEQMMVEARRRDHRKLGKELKLFTSSNLVGAGLPLFQPKGMIMRNAIVNYLWELHKDKGYSQVWTPHIAKESLYEVSGHAEKFGDELFRVQGKEENFLLKPMNCPHHMQIFADNAFSYRDLPIRYFEPATIYRDEKSGQLGGLTRVRAITQDDGHLFCRESQIKQEIASVVSVIREFYTTLGMMESYWVSLSVRDPQTPEKYLGWEDAWNTAEEALKEAAEENQLNYTRIEGEAAFYGPKLDFMFQDAIGREWQLATIQRDFNLADRFELSYTNEEGEEERPVVIHRAISGSIERFMGIMIEHFAGAFPLWLSPHQVTVLPVADVHNDYAHEVLDKLKEHGFHADIQYARDSLNKRIRHAEKQKVNYMLIIGDQECQQKSVSVRDYQSKEQESKDFGQFINELVSKRDNRDLT